MGCAFEKVGTRSATELFVFFDVNVDGQNSNHLGQNEGETAEIKGPAVRVVPLLILVLLWGDVTQGGRNVDDYANDVAETCSHKQDPSSQNNVPFAFVKPTGGDTHSSQQQQDGTEDGEDTGGPHHTEQILGRVLVVVGVIWKMVDL